jgi:adenine deaminase
MKNQTIKGHIVDVIAREIYDGEITISNGMIAKIRRHPLSLSQRWPYLMPGFIDSHVHIESSMLTPREYARVVVCHGTIGVVADPHEIANVLGVEGIDFMIRSGRQVRFNFLFSAPSCVPAVGGDFETSGAEISADDIEQLMARDDIGYLGEVMNYPGVLADDPELMRKIHAARAAGKPVDGHAPGLSADELVRYASAGITTNHECMTLEEGRNNMKAGLKVMIREGSAAKSFKALFPLISEYPDRVMLCTDDEEPDELEWGHINWLVGTALSKKINLWDVLQVACVNPQQHYGVRWGLLQEGDPATFITVDTLSPEGRVEQTFIQGKEVYRHPDGVTDDLFLQPEEETPVNRFEASPITASDIEYPLQAGKVLDVIVATDYALTTGHEKVTLTEEMCASAGYPLPEVQKIVVLNRYQRGARPVVGWVRGFGIRDGAIAGSIAHDSHNIVAVGSNDLALVQAINRVIALKGARVAVSPDGIVDLPLPIAGIMSDRPFPEVAERMEQLLDTARQIGCPMQAPFMTISFMCLPVIPALKITDKMVLNTRTFTKVQ